jgi:polyvinyl alcohol dehydrogenase (cytochrome)
MALTRTITKAAIFGLGAGAFLIAGAASAQPEPAGGRNGGGGLGGVRAGQPVFQQACAGCHTPQGLVVGDRTAPSLSTLQEFPPERIYDALTTGKMTGQAAALSDLQKRQVSEWLAARPLGSAEIGGMEHMKGHCTANPSFDAKAGPGWNGWSADLGNARFQPAGPAGLKAIDVPRLKLKWAFGLPQGADSFSQPTVVGGRVFFGSDNGFLYSVDARTGCLYWSFHAQGAMRSAPTVAEIKGHPGVRYAVFVGDMVNHAYAVDAQTGKQIWMTRVDSQPRSHMTASPKYYDGRLYVPISSGETLMGSNPKYECCATRGVVVAVDADTGKIVWRTESIAEKAAPRGKNPVGTQLWGPGGASIWNTPTIDPKRHVLYVGTGNAYTAPAAPTSDSILALDLETGRVLWHHQEFQGDAFLSGCKPVNDAGGNCPQTLGPDWDFGGASSVLSTLLNGKDILVAAGKGGVAVGLDPDRQGAVLWRTKLYTGDSPGIGGLVVFGPAVVGTTAYYPLNQPRGGLTAVDIRDGRILWSAGPLTQEQRGQSAAASAIPGVVFTGAWDGVIRAVSDQGKVVWDFNTAQAFDTVNGVPAKGGSLGQPGATIAGGMVFLSSGYIGTMNGAPGNVILAFAPG